MIWWSRKAWFCYKADLPAVHSLLCCLTNTSSCPQSKMAFHKARAGGLSCRNKKWLCFWLELSQVSSLPCSQAQTECIPLYKVMPGCTISWAWNNRWRVYANQPIACGNCVKGVSQWVSGTASLGILTRQLQWWRSRLRMREICLHVWLGRPPSWNGNIVDMRMSKRRCVVGKIKGCARAAGANASRGRAVTIQPLRCGEPDISCCINRFVGNLGT